MNDRKLVGSIRGGGSMGIKIRPTIWLTKELHR